MNPLSLSLPFLPAAMRGASLLASGGANLLQGLAAPQVPTPSQTTPPADNSARKRLQTLVSQQLSRGGFGDALPLEIVADGSGGIRVVSDHPQRQAIEQLLNENSAILQQFQELAQPVAAAGKSQGPLRLTIAATSGFDFSA